MLLPLPTARPLTDLGLNGDPDLPGYGRSERGDHTLGIPGLAHALIAILDGFEIAHASPQRVHRLVLVSPAILGNRGPLMPFPHRVREVGEVVPEHVTVAFIEGVAHAIEVSHPDELAHVIRSWLEGREIADDANRRVQRGWVSW